MRDEIHAAIPHRDPFLFVDRIVERGEGRLVTEWTVPADADFLRGHYPDRPLVPGVLICESAFQAGAILCAGDDDTVPASESVRLYGNWKAAGHAAELHIYSRGGHGFGMRTQGLPSDTWIERFGDWLRVQGLLDPVEREDRTRG